MHKKSFIIIIICHRYYVYSAITMYVAKRKEWKNTHTIIWLCKIFAKIFLRIMRWKEGSGHLQTWPLMIIDFQSSVILYFPFFLYASIFISLFVPHSLFHPVFPPLILTSISSFLSIFFHILTPIFTSFLSSFLSSCLPQQCFFLPGNELQARESEV